MEVTRESNWKQEIVGRTRSVQISSYVSCCRDVTAKFRFVTTLAILAVLFHNFYLCLCSVLVSYFACLYARMSGTHWLGVWVSPKNNSDCSWGKTNFLLLPVVEQRFMLAPVCSLVTTPTTPCQFPRPVAFFRTRNALRMFLHCSTLNVKQKHSFETSGSTRPTKQCSHPRRPESSPICAVYSDTRIKHAITPVARSIKVLKQVADLSSCLKMSAVYYSLWPD